MSNAVKTWCVSGSPEAKAKMLFDMYDVDGTGRVTRAEGKMMIK